MPTTPSTRTGQVINTLSGDALRRHLHGKSEGGRAQLAAYLVRNKVSFTDLSPAQVARLCAVNTGNLSRALGRAGSRGPQSRTLDRLIRKYGPDVLMQAVDRATTPTLQAAE